MLNLLNRSRWSPYVVGAGIGILSWITFGLMHKALGTSTSFVSAAGAIESLVAPDHVRANEYFVKTFLGEGKFFLDWQMMLVIGLFLGALISARLGRSYHVEKVPELWASRFGPSKARRYAAAFLGGVLVLFGARLADGCTSGHGISGGLQLAVSSWTFFISFFAAGLITAMLVYGKAGRRHAQG